MLNISKAGQAVGLESGAANRYATLLEAAFMIRPPGPKAGPRERPDGIPGREYYGGMYLNAALLPPRQ